MQPIAKVAVLALPLEERTKLSIAPAPTSPSSTAGPPTHAQRVMAPGIDTLCSSRSTRVAAR
jgi:hypothetical protein